MLLKSNRAFGLIVLVIGMILFSLCACSSSEELEEKIGDVDSEVKQLGVNYEEPLRVFYMDAGLLANFQNLYPDVKLELHKIYPGVDENDVDIEYWAKKYGDPDIILFNRSGSFGVEQEYEKGQVEDIRKYCEEDTTLDLTNYVAGTFDVLEYGDVLMGLPLSWSKTCLIVKESEMKDSELETLAEGYTGRELFEVLLAEIKKEKYSEKFCWLYSLYFMNNLVEVSSKRDGKLEMDEEMFKVLFEFSVLSEMNYYAAREAFGDFNEHANQRHSEPSLDPEFCSEGYFGSYLRGAPQVTAIYAKSVADMDQENVELFWIPTIDNGKEYIALVEDYAVIGKNSSRKQQAYEVIRMMMDMPITMMTQPSGNVPEIYSSVNIERSIEMLDYFNSFESKLIIKEVTGEVFHEMEQKKLDEEEVAEVKGVITGISNLYLDFSMESRLEFSKSYRDYRDLCIESGKINHEMCYAEMKKYFYVNSEIENVDEIKVINDIEEDSTIISTEPSKMLGENEEIKKLKEQIRKKEVNDTFFLGKIEQDNNFENGTESIEWIVLDKSENKVLVISKRVLEYLTFSKWESESGQDGIMYMAPKNYFTWKIERNQQRAWLFNELYENGFTESEKVIILQTHNESPSWRDLDSEEGSDDYLYIPSKEDIEQYMPGVQQRQAEMTEYVAEKAKKFIGDSEYIAWSLRTEGVSPKYSKQINENGEIGEMYCSVANGVRPVMWLDIS